MDILESIGNTPLVEIKTLNPFYPRLRILAKLEGNNPGGSVKDRAALFMIRRAQREGALTPGKTILEASSGNTGIALAMIGAALNQRVRIVMPESASLERRAVLQAMGAELELTPASQGIDGAVQRASQLLADEPQRFLMLDQYGNPANPQAHFETTGPEILEQAKGGITAFVAGMGTGGTLMGVGQFLKQAVPGLILVGVEPCPGHHIQGLKNMTESSVPAIFRREELDETITICDPAAFAATRALAEVEGIFAGISSGAALAGALRLGERLGSGTIVTLFPDRGDRYLSASVFASRPPEK
jgi:S-sulfo-L-cysteine synthase (O-acetyl-L-serine-dependent)